MICRLRRGGIFILVMMLSVSFPAVATVLREDVISYSLDYYELQQRESAEHEVLQQQQQQQLDEKKEAALSRWKERKDKISDFLNNLLITFEKTTEYNDNIFRDTTSKKDDIVHILSVGINYLPQFGWKQKRKTEFFFDFQGDVFSYSEGELREDTHTGLRTGLSYRLNDRYDALLDYEFVKDHATATGDTEQSDRFIEYITNTFGGKLSADWGRFPCAVRYTHAVSEYEEDFETSDQEQDIMTATAEVKISPKTQAFVEYDYGEIVYPKRSTSDSDYNFTTYSAGVRGKLSPKITGVAKFGWGEYDYENGIESDTENVSGEVTYNLSNRFLFSAGGSRSIEASTYSTADSSEQRTLQLGWRYFPPFNKKLTLRGALKFTNIDFENSEREDDSTRLRLIAIYGLNKRTKLSLAYARTMRDSTFADRDFTQNTITLKGAFEF